MSDGHLSAAEKSIAPFWIGRAEFASYDDGWRVVKIDLSSGGFPLGVRPKLARSVFQLECLQRESESLLSDVHSLVAIFLAALP
jgi:hypothetical protein